MKHLLLVFALMTSVFAYGQFWVTSVGTHPATATECAPFDLAIMGNKPASNYNLTSASATVSGSTINVVLVFTESGFGLPTITPYSELVPVTGATPAGTYSVVVDYTAAGNTELSTWSIDVDSCAFICSPDPTGLSSSIDVSGDVILSWTAVPGTIGCHVRGRELGAANWKTANPILGTEPTSYTVSSSILTPGATYEWAVQCACVISPLNVTGWSATSTFSIPLVRMSTAQELTLSPIPAQNQITLRGVETGTPYEIYNVTGSLVGSGQVSGPISTDELNTGMYFIRIQNEVLNFQIAR